jgi:hypothetical protein|uniref:Uncharacterized protein n=1 Tax=Halalkalibacterium halodurans TaxID=86665 RepID=A0A0M0KL62_ALKHA
MIANDLVVNRKTLYSSNYLIGAVHIFKLPIEQAADVLGISYSKLLKRQLQIIEKVEPSVAVIGSCSVPQTLLVEYVYDQLYF